MRTVKVFELYGVFCSQVYGSRGGLFVDYMVSRYGFTKKFSIYIKPKVCYLTNLWRPCAQNFVI